MTSSIRSKRARDLSDTGGSSTASKRPKHNPEPGAGPVTRARAKQIAATKVLEAGAQRCIADAYAAYKTYRAHGEYGQTYGFDLCQASATHFNQLRADLRGRGATLEKFRTDGKTPALPADLQAGDALLSEAEVTLFGYVLHNLTLKHTTGSVSRLNGNLLALKERERRGEAVPFRSTPLSFHDDDNVFFTIGFRDHPVPKMLLQYSPEAVTIPLEAAHRGNPTMVRGLWVGPHLTSLVNNQRNVSTLDLMGTRYTYALNWDSKTVVYGYERADGTRYARTVAFADQLLTDGHVGPGICYSFIEHLRFVGNPYRQHVLDAAARGDADVIAAAMAHLMPGYVNPEAKIPVRVALHEDFHSVAKVQVPEGRIDYEAFRKTIEDCDVEAFTALVKDIDWSTRRDTELYRFVFCHTVVENRDLLPLVDVLLQNSAPAFGDDMETNALDRALEEHAPKPIIARLLQHTEVDWRDPAVRIGAPVNDLKILKQACVRRDELLPMFVANGTDLRAYAAKLLPHMLSERIRFMNVHPVRMGENFDLLLASGAAEALEPHAQAVILMFLVMFGDAAAVRKLLAQTPIHPDVALPNGHIVSRDEDLDGKRESNSYQVGGNTALMAAVQSEALDVMEALLDGGANPNARSEAGDTPLSIVAGERTKWIDRRAEAELGISKLSKDDRERDRAEIDQGLEAVAAKIKQCDSMESLLVQHGATPASVPTNIELRINRKDMVHVVVRGLDKQGEPATLMGIKRNLDGSAHDQRELVGGFKSINDVDNTEAAWRYLKSLVNVTDAVRAQYAGALRVVHRFEQDGVAPTTHYKHTVFELDLGNQLMDFPVYAGGDWRAVHHVRDASMHRFPVAASHLAMVDALKRNNFADLDKLLTIEHDGYDMLTKAAREGDLALIDELLAVGTPMEQEGSEFYPVKEAIQAGQAEAVARLMSQEKSRADELWSLLTDTIELGDPNVLAAVIEHVKPSSLAMLGAFNAIREGKVKASDEIVEQLLRRSLDIDESHLHAFAAPFYVSVQRGFWTVASSLVDLMLKSKKMGNYLSSLNDDKLVSAHRQALDAGETSLAERILPLVRGSGRRKMEEAAAQKETARDAVAEV